MSTCSCMYDLTLSRLLGENKRIHLETDQPDYRAGEWVHISATILNESFEPVTIPAYTVTVDCITPRREGIAVKLQAVPDIPGLYEGVFSPGEAGQYVLRAAASDQEEANTVAVHVQALPLEQLEPAMQEQLLRRMAALSGGRYMSIERLPSLKEHIATFQKQAIVPRERELWDLPAVFVILLILAGIEWFIRRTYDLI